MKIFEVNELIYIVIGIAGLIGATLRYLLGIVINQWWMLDFPLVTLLINLIGCFLLGFVTTWFTRFNPHSHFKQAVGTGLIGSFTTFSTFSVETIILMTNAQWALALLYIFLSLSLGLIAAFIGLHIGKQIHKDVTTN